MTLPELLAHKKIIILERCLRLTLDTYPREAINFLREERDQFANPLGSTLRQGLELILDGLLASVDPERLLPALDAVVRMRAVQGFRPSEALAFTVHLKQAIREELRATQMSPELLNDQVRLESRIDQLTLAAFDLYTACREKIAELRVGEARAESGRLVRVVQAMAQGQGARVKGQGGES